MPKTVVLIATLDTKGTEAQYLKEQIEKHGVRTLVVDGGIMGQPQWEAPKYQSRSEENELC